MSADNPKRTSQHSELGFPFDWTGRQCFIEQQIHPSGLACGPLRQVQGLQELREAVTRAKRGESTIYVTLPSELGGRTSLYIVDNLDDLWHQVRP